MLTPTSAERAALLAATTKVCGRCNERKPREAFTPDAGRADGLHRLCRSCRAAKAVDARAQASVEREAPAPKPTGRGPERLEPGAILLALEELGASGSKLVRFEGLGMHDLPRVLRPFAVVGADGVLVVPRQALLDFVNALRRRVGEHAMRTIGMTDLTRNGTDTVAIDRAQKDRSRGAWHSRSDD